MAKLDPSEARTGSRQRLQRVMADAGVAARRVCEQLIAEGHVSVNDRTVTKLPVFVDPVNDDIRVDGRRLPKPERLLYVMLNKPEQTLTVASDEPGMDRRTVLDLVDHPAAARLFPVGRLDYDTTGLVILTNDGELTHRLTHARYGVVKTYQVLVRGGVDEERLESISKRLRAERRREARLSASVAARREAFGEGRQDVRVLKAEAGRTLLEVSLTEAKNKQIREVLAIVGCPVKKLTRVAIGPLVLSGLAPGTWRELTREEVHLLRDAASSRPGARKAPAQAPKNKSIRKGGRRPGTKPNAPAAEVEVAEPVQKLPPPPVSKPAPPKAPSIRKGPRVIKP
ncbi:MAG: pseudouridine synthase [Phycisphaerales bacterium]